MAVGSASKWHGLDRFARWAELLPQFDFVIVCPEAVISHLEVRWTANLIARPTSDRTDYGSALARLDAAVGSMAYDRWDSVEGAPLKVRDYVSSGIPTVLPYRDTNLSGLVDPCLLQLEDWQDVQLVARWLSSIKGRRVSETARSAVSTLTIEATRLKALFPIER